MFGAVMETSARKSADTCVQLADFLQGRKTSSAIHTLASTRDTDIAYRVYAVFWKICRQKSLWERLLLNIIVAGPRTYHETLISRRLYRVESGVESYVYLDDPQRKDLLYKAGE